MALGKGIDLPVEQQAVRDAVRIAVPKYPLHEVTHEIADQGLRITAGQMEMEEKIHEVT
jgi:hypothetical protein